MKRICSERQSRLTRPWRNYQQTLLEAVQEVQEILVNERRLARQLELARRTETTQVT